MTNDNYEANNFNNEYTVDDLNVIERKSFIKSMNFSSWVLSVIFIIIGFILAKYPESAIKTVCYIIGSVSLLFGIIKILIYLKKKNRGFAAAFDLSGGIVSCGVGIFLLVSPETVISIIPILVGIIILFHSVLKIKNAIDLSKVGYNNWWSMLVIAFITAILGVLIIVNPFNTVATLIRAIGIIFIIDGILSLSSYIFTDITIFKSERK